MLCIRKNWEKDQEWWMSWNYWNIYFDWKQDYRKIMLLQRSIIPRLSDHYFPTHQQNAEQSQKQEITYKSLCVVYYIQHDIPLFSHSTWKCFLLSVFCPSRNGENPFHVIHSLPQPEFMSHLLSFRIMGLEKRCKEE